MYYFDNKYIFEIENKKKGRQIFSDRKLLDHLKNNHLLWNTKTKIVHDNINIRDEQENEIDAEKIANSEPFVRINNRKFLKGTNNERFSVGEYFFTPERDIGSMVIYPGYEVELTFIKKIIYEIQDIQIDEDELDDETGEVKKVKKIIATQVPINYIIETKTYTQTNKYVNLDEIIKVRQLILRPQVNPVNDNENNNNHGNDNGNDNRNNNNNNNNNSKLVYIIIGIGVALILLTIVLIKFKTTLFSNKYI